MSTNLFPTWVPQTFISAGTFYDISENLLKISQETSSTEERIFKATLRFTAAIFLLPTCAMLGAVWHLSHAGVIAILSPTENKEEAEGMVPLISKETKQEYCMRHMALAIYNLVLFIFPQMAISIIYAAFPADCKEVYQKAATFNVNHLSWLTKVLG